MPKILIVSILLYCSGPTHPNYDGWFAITGRNAPRIMVLKRCTPKEEFEQQNFNKFCESAGKLLSPHLSEKSGWFCFRTGLTTKAKCVDIIRQNAHNKRVIRWGI